MLSEKIRWLNEKREHYTLNSLSRIYCDIKESELFSQDTIITCGPYNEKIVIIMESNFEYSIILSVNRIITDTRFYNINKNNIKIEKYFNHISLAKISDNLIYNLQNPKIKLISLAKPSVFTYPRFALGISDIARAIREDFRGDVSLIDLQLERNSDCIVKQIENEKPDIIGISMTFGLYDVLKNLLKAMYDTLLYSPMVIIGGSLAAINFEEILSEFPQVIVSRFEGEINMKQVIKYYHKEISLSDINAIAYMDNKTGIISTTDYPAPCEKSIISLPELDLLEPTLKHNGAFQIETSRGCYNACSFCPRKHKGAWRGHENDYKLIDAFLDHVYYWFSLDGGNKALRAYIVDEEFFGGESAYNYERALNISQAFSKHNFQYEINCRMNNVFNQSLTDKENAKKLESFICMHNNGLNRVLVGVESGVDTILSRFNKKITSYENIMGIRALTSKAIPVRFTYITFDPMMTMDELIQNYDFLGRTDLIMTHNKEDTNENLIKKLREPEYIKQFSVGIPFYYELSYMLVSLECFVGCNYSKNAQATGLVKNNVIKSIGKHDIKYQDKTIEQISSFSQMWIDRNFSMDYSLKSIAKIYPDKESSAIRMLRVIFKRHSYSLLGKMMFIVLGEKRFIKDVIDAHESEFIKKLRADYIDGIPLENIYYQLLENQICILKKDMESIKNDLLGILQPTDREKLLGDLLDWEKSTDWKKINVF